VSECPMSSACSTSSRRPTSPRLVALLLVALGCSAPSGPVVVPPPGGAVSLSIDGDLRMTDLDELAPQCVALVRDEARVPQGARLALLVPGGDSETAATSITLAAGLREAGYFVRRTHRRHLESGETLVEIFPISDGAVQVPDHGLRSWRVHVDVRIFSDSEKPAVLSRELFAETAAPLPRRP